MMTKTKIWVGVALLSCGMLFAIFFQVALKQFAECCQTSHPLTKVQVQQDFPVFTLACKLTVYDFFGKVEMHDPPRLIMSAIRRFYSCIAIGRLLIATGCFLLLGAFLRNKFSVILRWATILIMCAILLDCLWICCKGPRGGSILTDEEIANKGLHGTR